jgi:hypothetical protein
VHQLVNKYSFGNTLLLFTGKLSEPLVATMQNDTVSIEQGVVQGA